MMSTAESRAEQTVDCRQLEATPRVESSLHTLMEEDPIIANLRLEEIATNRLEIFTAFIEGYGLATKDRRRAEICRKLSGLLRHLRVTGVR
jgi:hypothetical protein